MSDCPHKTVTRFYDSRVYAGNVSISLWKCDWCGQEFRPSGVSDNTAVIEVEENSGTE
jgi:hypothetical protein